MRYRETLIGDKNLTRCFKFNMIKSIMFSAKPFYMGETPKGKSRIMPKTVNKIPAIWAVSEDPDEFTCGNEANTFNEKIKDMSRKLINLRNVIEGQLQTQFKKLDKS